MKKFSLFNYLILVCLLSWPFQILSWVTGAGLFGRYALNATSMCMVAVATFIYGKYILKDGFKNEGWRLGKPIHYLAIIGLVVFIWVVPTIIDTVSGNINLPTTIETWQIIAILVFLFVTIIPAFGEEFGWRGYMLPHLVGRFTPRKAVFFSSIIWWLWHFPILMENFYYVSKGAVTMFSAILTIVLLLVLSGLPAIGHGILFAYIWQRTESIVIVTLYHTLIDAVRDSIQITIGMGEITSIWINVVFLIIGIVLLWKGNWNNLEKFKKTV